MAVFGTESGSIFVACQASDKNSKSHLSPASWKEDQTIYGAILKAKKPEQSDKLKIRKLEFCPFTKVVEGFGSVMWIWEYQGHHATSADLADGLRAHYLCTEKSLTGGADRVLVHVNDLGKKLQAFYETTNEILDAWRDSEAHRGLTKEQLFGEGAVMEPADALEARDRAREDARTAI
jgi:hypothetical protein